MKKNRWLQRVTGLLLITLALIATVSAAAVGTTEDPLVSLSYLQKTFLGQVMADVEAMLTQRDEVLTAALDEKIAAAAENQKETPEGITNRTFTVVTMSKGQTLMGEIGCEIMLRVGTASCVSSSKPGLIDQTDASILNHGEALVKNHLYMMTIEDRGVEATAGTVKLLVRGTYTLQ
ncbi:MAG: hypothetical protein E7445_03300 [Ruminococcaceae bacterium]|nr:hypothetical protein [Oscillospiraceae bacterium]